MEKRERKLIKCFIELFGVERILECIAIKDIINNVDIDDVLCNVDDDDMIDYLCDDGYVVYWKDEDPSRESIIEKVEDICRELQPNGYIGKEEAKNLICDYLDFWMNRGF